MKTNPQSRRWRQHVRRLGVVLALMVTGAVALPAAASAAYNYYYGSPTASATWPYYCYAGNPCSVRTDTAYRPLEKSSAVTTNGQTVCVSAYEADTGASAAVVCTASLAEKGFGSGLYRYAYSRGTTQGDRPYGRARSDW